MAMFDDLIPGAAPQQQQGTTGLFDDLIPAKPAGQPPATPQPLVTRDNPPDDDEFVSRKAVVDGVELRLHRPTGRIYDPQGNVRTDQAALDAFGKKQPTKAATAEANAQRGTPTAQGYGQFLANQPQPESMTPKGRTTIGELGRGIADRAIGLVGGFLAASTATSGAPVPATEARKWLPWLTDEDLAQAQRIADETIAAQRGLSRSVIQGTAKAKKSVDYQPLTDFDRDINDPFWQGRYFEAFKNIPGFAAEQFITSAPNMAAAMVAPQLAFPAETGRIAMERAGNDKRDFITNKDMAIAAPVGAAITVGERLGLGRILAPGPGVGGILKAGAVEGGTEFVQEGAEDVASTIDTQKGWDPQQSLKMAVAGAIGGAPAGAAAAAPQAIAESLQQRQPPPPPGTASPQGQQAPQPQRQGKGNRERIEPRLFDDLVPPQAAPGTAQPAPGQPPAVDLPVVPGWPTQERPRPKVDEATDLLLQTGYSLEQIGDMNPTERQQAAQEARQQGYTPLGTIAPDAPPIGTTPRAPVRNGTRGQKVTVQAPEDLDAVRQTVNTEPTDGQKAAGNYQHAHINVQGIDIAIENPKGSVRRGKDPDTGQDWASPQLPADYGRIKRTTGKDGDQVDVYIGPNPLSPRVFVIDQMSLKNGKFDEHKAVMGAESLDEAVELYVNSFDNPTLDRIGDVTEMSVDEFKAWVANPRATKRPAGSPSTAPVNVPNIETAPQEVSTAPDPEDDFDAAFAAALGSQVENNGAIPTRDQADDSAIEKAFYAYLDAGKPLNDPARIARAIGTDVETVGRLIQNAIRKGSLIQTPPRWKKVKGQQVMVRPQGLRRPRTFKTPANAVEAIAQFGGIRDDNGDLRAMDAHRILTRHGPLVRPNGRHFDEVIEMLLENQFITDPGWNTDRQSETTIQTVLDIISDHLAGKPLYRPEDMAEMETIAVEKATEKADPERVAAVESEMSTYSAAEDAITALVTEYGIDLAPREKWDAIDLVLAGMNPDDAIEAVVIHGDNQTIDDLSDWPEVRAMFDKGDQDAKAVILDRDQPPFPDAGETDNEVAQAPQDQGPGNDAPRIEDQGPAGESQPVADGGEADGARPDGRSQGETTAEIAADDTDETVTVTLTANPPWDFNDTFPLPDIDQVMRLEQEGRNPFDGTDDLLWTVEEVVYTVQESLNEMISAQSESIAAFRARDGIGKGLTKIPKGKTAEAYRAELAAEGQRLAKTVTDIAAVYADFMGDKAAKGMVRYVKQVVKGEQPTASAPAPQKPAAQQAPAATVEPGAENRPQLVIPGAEQVSEAEAIKAAKAEKARKELEARRKQSKLRKPGQQSVEDQEGGLFGGAGPAQSSLLAPDEPQTQTETVELANGDRVSVITLEGFKVLKTGWQYAVVYPENSGEFYRVGTDYAETPQLAVDKAKASIARPPTPKQPNIEEALNALPDEQLKEVGKILGVRQGQKSRIGFIEAITALPHSQVRAVYDGVISKQSDPDDFDAAMDAALGSEPDDIAAPAPVDDPSSWRTLTFVRMGDFYEAFDEDAETAAREMGITLTKRGDRKMAGFPAHAWAEWTDKLKAKGYKVKDATPAPKPKTAGQAATSAIKNTALGIDDVVKGLGALFGDKNKLGSGPTFDEETYAKALPFFKAGVAHFKDAGKDVYALVKALVDHLRKSGISDAAIEEMRPFLKRFWQDIKSGKEILDAPGSSDVLESDSGDANAGDGVGATGVSPAAKPDGGRAGTRGKSGSRSGGRGSGRGGGVPKGDALVVGEDGNLEIPPREPDAGGSNAPDREPGGSDGDRKPGLPDERIPAQDAIAAAAKTADIATRRQQQRAAESIAVKPGDRDNISETLPMLHPEQQDDVFKTEQRFAMPDGHGMLLTNGTGTGKTFSGLGVIKRFERQGKTNILIVAPSQGILMDWMKAAKNFGLDVSTLADTKDKGTGIVATTYANLGQNMSLADREWDLVVTDEAHKLSSDQAGTATTALEALRSITLHPEGMYRRAQMVFRKEYDRYEELHAAAKVSKTAEAVEKADAARRIWQEKYNAARPGWEAQARGKTLMLSATPFAYHYSLDYAQGYLFSYPDVPQSSAYNAPGPREAFYIQNFGYSMRYGKLTKPDKEVRWEVMERQFHEKLKREGSLSGRALEVERDYDRKFILVKSGIGTKIDEALKILTKGNGGKYMPLWDIVAQQFDYLTKMRLLEAIKADASVDYIRKSIAMGRKVVVFHDYNSGGGISPFKMEFKGDETANVWIGNEQVKVNLLEQYRHFMAANPWVEKLDFEKLQSPIATLTKAFPDALVYNGTVADKVRDQAKALFNDDESGRNLIIVQSAAGEAGISLHDTTGKHQRVLLNLGMPGRPMTALQEEGRIYRVGQESDALFRYMNTGTNWERWAFAGSIAQRSGTAENLAMGDTARVIKQSFIDAFEGADDFQPGPDEGRGGKEADRPATTSMSEFERAKTHYFAQGRIRGRRDQREGTDYFPTPEPLGLKMVEWANIKPGESILEPSAGHGAIARFFPDDTARTLVEKEDDLAGRAALASPGARVVVGPFESLDIVNKYDAIVMNPPFGVGGKLAVEHLSKAAKHLRNGGRIVALMPRGGMADKRMEKWYESDEANGLYLIARIDLPSVTFERAGTSVSATVYVYEKQTDKDVTPPPQIERDYTSPTTINEFFDRIEYSELRPRMEPITKETDTPTEGSITVDGIEFELRSHSDGKSFLADLKSYVPQRFRMVAQAAEANGGRYVKSSKTFTFGSAEARRAFLDRVANPPEEPEVAAPTPGAGPGSITFKTGEFKHTKTLQPIFVATLDSRVDGDTFNSIRARAKGMGGNYSSFRGGNAIPGFHFATAAARDTFVAAFRPQAPLSSRARGLNEGGPTYSLSGWLSIDTASTNYTPIGDFKVQGTQKLAEDAKRYVRMKGRASGREVLLGFDERGSVVADGVGAYRQVGWPEDVSRMMMDPAANLAIHHNHPSSSTLSQGDLALMAYPGLKVVWAHGNDHSSYRASIPKALRALPPVRLAKGIWNAYKLAEGLTYDLFQGRVNQEKISVDTATAESRHMVVKALHKIGLIDYYTTFASSITADDAEAASLARAVESTARSAIRDFIATEDLAHADAADRNAVAVRHIADMGIAPLSIGSASTRNLPASGNAGSRQERGRAQAPVQLRLPGVEEGLASASRPAPPFYSALIRSVEGMKQDKAPASQWMGMIRNAPGVKAEEVAWLGLEDWLGQQSGTVTKAAMLDFLRANQVQVREVEKGGPPRIVPDGHREKIQEWLTKAYPVDPEEEAGPPQYDEEGAWLLAGRAIAGEADAIEELEGLGAPASLMDPVYGGADQHSTNTKFSEYQLPGGENYRELLLTLPGGTPKVDTTGWRVVENPNGFTPWAVENAQGEVVAHFMDNPHEDSDLIARAATDLQRRNDMSGNAAYRSGHWEEANVLAHVRFNERTDAEGRKVLFIEEIQSDWAQSKRKGWDTPNAPFIGSTEAWAGLALRRMIRWAAESGFDSVAWTPGDVQADRYDLSKQISRIRYEDGNSGGIGLPRMDGDPGPGVLYADDLNGKQVIQKYLDDPAKAADYIGKEAAEKLFAAKATAGRSAGMGVRIRELSGLDLKVGGEGMRGFYDSILVTTANKLGKKFGAKVGRTAMDGVAVDMVSEQGFPDTWVAADSYGNALFSSVNEDEVRAWVKNNRSAHSLPITPAMREAAMQGLPLFKRKSSIVDIGEIVPNRFRFAISGKQRAEIVRQIQEDAQRILGHHLTRVYTALDMTAFDRGENEDALFDPETGVVYIALQSSIDPRLNARHEFIHALRNAGVMTKPEWAALSRIAQAGWMERFDIRERYQFYNERFDLPPHQIEELLIEEAIADAFAAYSARNRSTGNSIADRIFEKIKRFLESVVSMLNGRGFVSVAQILEDIETGKVGQRQAYSGDTRGFLLHARQESRGRDVTETAAFRNWFGNSKVVDAQGKPLVVYHGTDQSFDTFDRTEDIGFHFGTKIAANARIGASPAAVRDTMQRGGVELHQVGRNLIPVYLKIENPLRLPDLNDWAPDAVVDALFNEGIVGIDDEPDNQEITREQVGKWLRRAGYDGIVYRNKTEGGGRGGDSYIAFSPTQIKSVFNSGAFDPKNPAVLSSRQRIPAPKNPPAGTFEAPHDERMRRALFDSTDTLLNRIRRAGSAAGIEARRKLQDREVDLIRTQSAIRESGRTISEAQDVYLASSLYPGRVAQRDRDFVEDHVKPLVADISNRGLTLEQVDEFVRARHAEERNLHIATKHKPGSQFALAATDPNVVGGSGLSLNQALDIIDRARQMGKLADLEAVGNKIVAINRTALAKKHAEGLITDDTYNLLTAMFRYYVPLRGDEDADSNDHPDTPRAGSRYDIRGREFQTALGRRTISDSPLAYTIMQAREAIIRVEKNRVGKRLLRLAQANPNVAFWEINKVVLKRVIDPRTGFVRNVYDRGATQAENVFAVKVGGQTYHIVLHHDGLLKAMKGIGAENMHDIVVAFHKINRFLASLYTSYDPEFIFRNFVRDLQQAGIVLQEENISGLVRKVITTLPQAAMGMRLMLKDDLSTPWARLAREYADAGGKMGFMDRADIVKEKRTLDRLMAEQDPSAALKAKMILRDEVFGRIDRWNDTVENTIRLATYAAVRDAGYSQDKAASVARELTVNFNRKGEWGPHINAFYMFANASTQGMANMVMRIGRSRKMQKIVFGIALAAIGQDFLNRLIAGDDDDDKNRYDKIPDSIKSKNFIVMFPKSIEEEYGVPYFKWPLPLGYNMFHVIGTQFGHVMAGARTPMEATGEIVSTLGDTFNPLGSGGSKLNIFTPTLLDPFVDIEANVDYFGQAITPRAFDDTTPDAQRYRENVNPAAKVVTDTLTRATGGNDERAGGIDWSPESVEHVWEFATGGIGRLVSRIGSLTDTIWRGEEVDASKIPFARVFVGQASSFADRDTFYDIKDEAKITRREYEARLAEGDRAAADAVRRNYPREFALMTPPKNAKDKWSGPIIDAEKELTKLRKDRRAVAGNQAIGDKKKREIIDGIRQREDQIMLEIRKIWNRADKPLTTPAVR